MVVLMDLHLQSWLDFGVTYVLLGQCILPNVIVVTQSVVHAWISMGL
jgi:hypothetical protein